MIFVLLYNLLFRLLQGGLMMLGVIVVVGVINPFVFIPILPLIALFLLLRRIFIAAARNVKRIEATCMLLRIMGPCGSSVQSYVIIINIL